MEKDPGRLTFEDLRARAIDPSVPIYEKLGFTDSAHEDSVDEIFEDFRSKLPALNRENIKILDIGCGCGELVKKLIRNAETLNQDLYLVDSKEVLDLIQPSPRVTKLAGKFPQEHKNFIDKFTGGGRPIRRRYLLQHADVYHARG